MFDQDSSTLRVNENTTSHLQGEREAEPETDDVAQSRSGGPFGGLSPAEAGRRSAEARREKAGERAEAAELDKLTVEQRFSTALARKLPYAKLEEIVEALAGKAAEGHVQHAKLLLDYVKAMRGSDDDLGVDAVDPNAMSPAQRAVWRARVLEELSRESESPATEPD